MIMQRALVPWGLAAALLSGGAGAVGAQQLAVDTALLGRGPYGAMHALLEKTIFKVDVLTLDIQFGLETAHRLATLVDGRPRSRLLADSIAALALDAHDVWARIRFKRHVSVGQFLDAIRKNLRRAREAGIIDSVTHHDVLTSLPGWYAFLRGAGIRDGDEMMYRIRGDTLRTIYRDEGGGIRLDQTDIGAGRRLSVMGGYFAPHSDFREGLIDSLFERRRL